MDFPICAEGFLWDKHTVEHSTAAKFHGAKSKRTEHRLCKLACGNYPEEFNKCSEIVRWTEFSKEENIISRRRVCCRDFPTRLFEKFGYLNHMDKAKISADGVQLCQIGGMLVGR